ncbi:MAG TPA: CAP domain-containing protein [Acidobacteriota bacterium]|nr:CAP domain-containing protein [Acidobacteriota bacterium]
MSPISALRFGLVFLCAAASVVAAELSDAIQPESLDERLIARAIFDETNRVRAQLGLKPLGAEPKLDDAADTQARVGAVFRPPSHTNPFPLIATPLDRVKFAGLEPERVAENIAQISIYDVPSGGSIYYLKNDRTLRDARNGQPVRTHTYESFAREIVQAWMNSPGHRENIVSTKLRYLGCAAKMSRSQDDIPMLFAVQAFYTPKKGKR